MMHTSLLRRAVDLLLVLHLVVANRPAVVPTLEATSSASVFGGDRSVPEVYSLAHLGDHAPETQAVVRVDVRVLARDGTPAPEGRFYCYNHDLALCYPPVDGGRTLQGGRLEANLPRGRYTTVARSPRFFLTRSTTITINAPTSVTLKADAVIRARAWNFAGRPLPNAEVVAYDSAMKPLLQGFHLSGQSFQEGPITLGVCADSTVDLMIIGRPPVGYSEVETYLLIQPEVRPGDDVSIRPPRGRLAHINLDQRYSQPTSRRVWEPSVDGERLTSDEMLCGLYTAVCHRSLCGLFHLAGFDVAESKVQRVRDALASLPDP